MFQLIFQQSLIHAFRKGGGAFGTCAFYIIIVTLFTFALGPRGMHEHAGAIMCVAMLLASITAMPLLYERDYEDGMLEQYLLQPVALELVVLAKILGHWLSIIGPIILLSPAIALFADLPSEEMIDACLMLALASVSMIAIASIAASLTLGARRGGLLQALIILPLYTPILIFAASNGGQGALLFLGGIMCFSVPVCCYISSFLIKINQD